MKTVTFLIFNLFLIGATMAAPNSGATRGVDQESRYYNPKTAETIRGEVIAVEELGQLKDMGHGVHLIVKTANEMVPVHLGPSWFLVDQPVQIRRGDTVRVEGSRVTINQKPAIIAAEVFKGASVLKLRDRNGIPVWNKRQPERLREGNNEN